MRRRYIRCNLSLTYRESIMETKYNGWTNYETWLVNLWIDNSGDQDYWNDSSRDLFEYSKGDSTFTKEENAIADLADLMREYYDELASQWMPDQSSMFADMINASLREVNWREIAEHYIDEITVMLD